MFTQLKFEIQFSSTGKRFSKSILFKPGLTVISGRNESGKSLILELLEYSLFGTAALRAPLAEYQSLITELDFTVLGVSHKVKRSGSTVNLNDKVHGAAAVNKAIIDILGFDLDVFRITCSAKQGDLNKLTNNMGPTQRRRMVDQVVGLDQLDTIEKKIRDDSNSIKKLRDNLTAKLVQPVEPVKPEGYLTKDEILDFTKHKLIVQQLKKPQLPPEPIRGKFDDDIEQYQSSFTALLAERSSLERALRAIPTTNHTRSDVDTAKRYYEQARRGEPSKLSRDQVNELLGVWDSIKKANQSVTCPDCGTSFIPGTGEHVELLSEPTLSVIELTAELKRINLWEGIEWEHLDPPAIAESMLPTVERALSQMEQRKTIEAQLEKLVIPPSREDELEQKKKFDNQMLVYDSQITRYIDDMAAYSDALSELDKLPPVPNDLENLIEKSQIYNEQNLIYGVTLSTFNSNRDELAQLNSQVEEFTNAVECIKYIRSQIKQHLIPSLNRVASHLLSEMTNGARNKIYVDENFDISVDGQPIQTLSGSGLSISNLAIRIALGQVLTQKVAPIFMGDELDHDSDPERSEAIYVALKSVSKILDQVIIVSHKEVTGDNEIKL